MNKLNLNENFKNHGIIFINKNFEKSLYYHYNYFLNEITKRGGSVNKINHNIKNERIEIYYYKKIGKIKRVLVIDYSCTWNATFSFYEKTVKEYEKVLKFRR